MKQWARKLLIFLSCVTLGVSSAFGFVGCKKNKPTDSSSSSSGVTECTQHTWNDGEVTKKATCIAKGEKTYTCTKCSATKTEEIGIDPNGHTYKESKEAATCVLHGTTTYTCQDCQHSYSEVSETAKGHALSGCTWTPSVKSLGNCQYQAVETTTCPTCKIDIVRNVGEAYTKHGDATVSITKAATCKEKGTKTVHCDTCSETESVDIAIDANAHAWDDGSTNGNITTYHCTHDGCSATKTTVSVKEQVTATVPASAIKAAGEVELQNAAIKLPEEVANQLGNGNVTMKADTMSVEELPDGVDKAKLPENATIFDFSISNENETIATFTEKITVTVPYTLEDGMDPDEVCVYYIKEDDGTIVAIEAKYYEVNGEGFATFETDHFSLYTIVRLTAEQRCAAYGHKYETKTVAATCGVEGYTVEICSVCKDTKPRTNFTAALKHDYAKNVVAATCSDMGYTVYTCKHCQDTYVSDYTAKKAHSYVDTVVAPTCTAEGYTTHTCSECHYSYSDNNVAAKGHTYQNGACSVCGKKDPNATTTNFYYNMVESLFTADTYYVEMSNVVIDVAYTYSNGDAETQNYKLDLAQLQIGLDEKGLVGKGEGTIIGKRVLSGHTSSEENIVGQFKIVFRDGNMYEYVKGNLSAGEVTEQYYVSPQFVMPEESGMSMMTEMLGEMIEPLTNLLSALGAQDNSKANQLLGKIIEYCFEKKATDDGYTFTLNTKRVKEVYNAVKNSTISQLFDTVFGEGAFAATQSYLVASVNKTIPVFAKEATTELEKWGIPEKALFTTINQIVNAMMGEAATEQPFDIEALLQSEDMKNVTVAQLLVAAAGGMIPAETDFAALINNAASSVKDAKIFDFIPEEQLQAIEQAVEMADGILKQVPVVLTTDKSGAVLSVSVETKNLKPIDNTGKVVGENGVYELLNVTVDGSVKFVIDGTYAGAYEDVVKAAQKIETAYTFDSNIDGENFKTFVIEDSVFLWSKDTSRPYTTYKEYNADDDVEETHNGQACTKKRILVSNLFKKGSSYGSGVSATKDCNGWFISDECYWNAGKYWCNAWFDANGNIVDISDLEYQGSTGYGWYMEIAYNPTTGNYALSTQHNWVLSKTIEGEGCYTDTKVYKCTVCGACMTEGGYERHDTEEFVELLPGSTTCEDGVLVGWKCVDCGRVTSTYTSDDHEYITKKHVIENTSDMCGNLTFVWSECACGKKISCSDSNWRYGNEHMFSGSSEKTVDEETHAVIVETFVCGVKGCGYKVTKTTEWKWDKANCKATTKFTYVFGNNDWKFEYTETTAAHSSKSTSTEVSNEYGTGYRYTETCTVCGKTLSDYTWLYDSYGRETYYEDHLSESGYGWYKVFDSNCHYTVYYLNSDSQYSGTQHVWENVSSDEWSCTQYREVGYVCKCCNEKEVTYYAPNHFGRYDEDGHNWHKDTESGEWICDNCGTHSHYGVEGIISLEDMCTEDAIKVGYFNFREWNIDYDPTREECPIMVDIVVNYDPDPDATKIKLESEGLFTKTVTSPEDVYSEMYGYSHYRESGIVTVDTTKLLAALQALDSSVEVETISIVFSVRERFLFEDKKDSETYQECALTFSMKEFASLFAD